MDLPQDSGSSGTNGDAKRDKQNNLHPESFLSLPDSTIMKKDVQNPDDTNFESMYTFISRKLCSPQTFVTIYVRFNSLFFLFNSYLVILNITNHYFIFISASHFSYPIILFYLSLFPLVSNGNRREPAELSFHSVTFDVQTSTSTGDGYASLQLHFIVSQTILFFLLFSTAVRNLKFLYFIITMTIIFTFIISESENKTVIKNKNIMHQNLNNWPQES